MVKLILADVLKRKKMSKRQFAIRLGIPYHYVFRYFREGYDPKLSVMARWARALDCRVRDLFKDVR